MKRAVFLTVKGDFHTFIVGQNLLRQFGNKLEISMVNMDERSVSGGFSWNISNSDGTSSALIKNNDGEWVDLKKSDLIWCRRFTRAQRQDNDNDFLTKQWDAAGWFLANYANNKWIDKPASIINAENKPQQLIHAREAGFSIPNTLVSQDPDQIKNFFESEPGGIIVKPLKASTKKQIFTVDLTMNAFNHPNDFKAFPAIYQQKIGGDHHLRIVCLPDKIFVFLIKSKELDWRKRNDIDIQNIDTDSDVADKCRRLLDKLHLTMGVIDAKIINGEIYFLEVNPQGQFLFLEAFTGVNLTNAYAGYFAEMLN